MRTTIRVVTLDGTPCDRVTMTHRFDLLASRFNREMKVLKKRYSTRYLKTRDVPETLDIHKLDRHMHMLELHELDLSRYRRAWRERASSRTSSRK
jgi:hypothetical protein